MLTTEFVKRTKNRLKRSTALRQLARLRRDERGNILIMAAFMLPVMVGAMALGGEMSYRYHQQRKIQHAADVAAHGAGVRAAYGDPKSTFEPIGQSLAIDAAWDQSGTYTLTDTGPTRGDYVGQATGPNGGQLIEVVLTEIQPRMFSKIWNNSDITVEAFAVAEVQQARTACVLSLDPSAARAMEFSGSTSLTLAGCDIASNSDAVDSVYQGGSSSVEADCINAVGYVDDSGGVSLSVTECVAARENQPPTSDPYKTVPDVDETQISCSNWNTVTSGPPKKPKNVNASEAYTDAGPPAWTTNAMRFCAQTVSMKGKVNFGPGIYIIDGVDMRINANAEVTGTDVMFYLTNGGSVTINGSGQLQLTAMTSGPFAPILFYSDRNNSATSHQLNGNSSSYFEGVMYFPNGDLNYNGGAGISGACTQVIANTVTFTGNSDFRSDCTNYPFKDVVTSALVQLID